MLTGPTLSSIAGLIFISDGQAVTLSPASLSFRQQLTLDPNHKPGLPNPAQVDGRLIGPITDFFTLLCRCLAVGTDGQAYAAGRSLLFQARNACLVGGRQLCCAGPKLD